jgi:hypothetical protein
MHSQLLARTRTRASKLSDREAAARRIIPTINENERVLAWPRRAPRSGWGSGGWRRPRGVPAALSGTSRWTTGHVAALARASRDKKPGQPRRVASERMAAGARSASATHTATLGVRDSEFDGSTRAERRGKRGHASVAACTRGARGRLAGGERHRPFGRLMGRFASSLGLASPSHPRRCIWCGL